MQLIPGFENYLIDKQGHVLNTKTNKYLTQTVTDRNYLVVTLFKKNIDKRFRVHRLVALTYLPNNENKPHVNHLDGDRQNNHVDNLEWCTHQENVQHSFKKLGKKIPRAQSIYAATKSALITSKKVICTTTGEIFLSTMDAYRKTNIDSSSISKACRGLAAYAGKQNKKPLYWKYL